MKAALPCSLDRLSTVYSDNRSCALCLAVLYALAQSPSSILLGLLLKLSCSAVVGGRSVLQLTAPHVSQHVQHPIICVLAMLLQTLLTTMYGLELSPVCWVGRERWAH